MGEKKKNNRDLRLGETGVHVHRLQRPKNSPHAGLFGAFSSSPQGPKSSSDNPFFSSWLLSPLASSLMTACLSCLKRKERNRGRNSGKGKEESRNANASSLGKLFFCMSCVVWRTCTLHLSSKQTSKQTLNSSLATSRPLDLSLFNSLDLSLSVNNVEWPSSNCKPR